MTVVGVQLEEKAKYVVEEIMKHEESVAVFEFYNPAECLYETLNEADRVPFISWLLEANAFETPEELIEFMVEDKGFDCMTDVSSLEDVAKAYLKGSLSEQSESYLGEISNDWSKFIDFSAVAKSLEENIHTYFNPELKMFVRFW